MAETELQPMEPLGKDVDLGSIGNMGSTYHKQSTKTLLEIYDTKRFQHPDLGYIVADGREWVLTVEVIEFAIRSKNYAKGDPAVKEALIKTRDHYLSVLAYDKALFAREGLLRLHECMLTPDQYLQRQARKADEELSEYLEYYEHQAGVRIILNLGERRPAPTHGELDTCELSPSE